MEKIIYTRFAFLNYSHLLYNEGSYFYTYVWEGVNIKKHMYQIIILLLLIALIALLFAYCHKSSDNPLIVSFRQSDITDGASVTKYFTMTYDKMGLPGDYSGIMQYSFCCEPVE